MSHCVYCINFFFNDTANTQIYTYLHSLSLHDALPICTGLFQGLKGYLGKPDNRYKSDSSIKSSAMHTFSEFKKLFSEFIIKYHNQPHSGLNGRTPAEIGREHV